MVSFGKIYAPEQMWQYTCQYIELRLGCLHTPSTADSLFHFFGSVFDRLFRCCVFFLFFFCFGSYTRLLLPHAGRVY